VERLIFQDGTKNGTKNKKSQFQFLGKGFVPTFLSNKCG